MKWKNASDFEDWDGGRPCPAPLRLFTEIVDLYRISALDGKQITITSFWRDPTERKSYHPKGHAVDIRTKDMEPADIDKMEQFMRAVAGRFNAGELRKQRMEIQVVPHHELRGLAHQHIHVEIDDGEPIKA